MDLPTTQGMWPAFWLNPNQVQWPTGGEIDILENRGSQPNLTSSAFHWQKDPGPCCGQHQYVYHEYTATDDGVPVDFHAGFHTYAVEWEANQIRFYVDGNLHFAVVENSDMSDANFTTAKNIILNLAIGGDFGGDPNGSTVFPQTLLVDYVRFWQLQTGLAGDYNGDGHVDAADYTVWRNSDGQSGIGLPADGSGNGSVGPEDYEIWKSSFGGADPPGAGSSVANVPEPAATILIMVGVLLLVSRHIVDVGFGLPRRRFLPLRIGALAASVSVAKSTVTAREEREIMGCVQSVAWIVIATLAVSVVGADLVVAQIPNLPGWQLSWHDEFDGTSLNGSNWVAANRQNSANNEKQYYRTEQVLVTNGNLQITATNQPLGNKQYRSGLITSQARFGTGRFEARIDLPTTQGMWPAFWLNPNQVQWPTGGEIDILENKGGRPNVVSSAYHWQTNPGPCCGQHQYVFHEYVKRDEDNALIDFHDGFHIYAVEWEPTQLRFYVDGTLHFTVDQAPDRPIFDTPKNIILNLAVGGDFGGDPNDTTVFPQTMLVDYVRVWQPQTGMAGDYNGDGQVDAADYTIWRDSNGQSGISLPADGSGNGTVGPEDYDVWKANFRGQDPPGGGSSSIRAPEPTAAVSMSVGILMLCARRFGYVVPSGRHEECPLPSPAAVRAQLRGRFDANRARLVRRLVRIRVEDRVRQLVRRLVVHRDEHLPGLNGWRDDRAAPQLASLRPNGDQIAGAELEPGGVLRIQLDVQLLRIELAEHGRLRCARLRVPLGGRAAARQQQERIFLVRLLGQRARRFA